MFSFGARWFLDVVARKQFGLPPGDRTINVSGRRMDLIDRVLGEQKHEHLIRAEIVGVALRGNDHARSDRGRRFCLVRRVALSGLGALPGSFPTTRTWRRLWRGSCVTACWFEIRSSTPRWKGDRKGCRPGRCGIGSCGPRGCRKVASVGSNAPGGRLRSCGGAFRSPTPSMRKATSISRI